MFNIMASANSDSLLPFAVGFFLFPPGCFASGFLNYIKYKWQEDFPDGPAAKTVPSVGDRPWPVKFHMPAGAAPKTVARVGILASDAGEKAFSSSPFEYGSGCDCHIWPLVC